MNVLFCIFLFIYIIIKKYNMDTYHLIKIYNNIIYLVHSTKYINFTHLSVPVVFAFNIIMLVTTVVTSLSTYLQSK